METAWTARKLFGGAMRQSGILAAAALYGVDHHIGRLEQDHLNARTLAQGLDGVGGATVVPPDTNIVMIDLPPGGSSASVAAAARACDVLVSEWSPTRVRLVTHLDVSASDCQRAVDVLRDVLSRSISSRIC
jgi:threonine aldolase